MNRKWYGRGVWFLVLLLFPALVTQVMSGEEAVAQGKTKQEGYYILADGERIPLEEYLTGAVAWYMPESYEDEAYKAMVILLRTYVRNEMGDDREIEEEKLALSRCQTEEMEIRFGETFAYQYGRYQKAVRATRGEVIRYEGNLILPYFHQVSAGKTNALSGYPYLLSVDSEMDLQAENYLSLRVISVEECVRVLSELCENSGEETEQVWTAEGLMNEMTIETGEGEYKRAVIWREHRIPAAKIKEAFSLPSTAFVIEEYEGKIRIMTRGIGHGIGLSIYGCEKMAEDGKSCKEILKHYYSNITVSDE